MRFQEHCVQLEVWAPRLSSRFRASESRSSENHALLPKASVSSVSIQYRNLVYVQGSQGSHITTCKPRYTMRKGCTDSVGLFIQSLWIALDWPHAPTIPYTRLGNSHNNWYSMAVYIAAPHLLAAPNQAGTWLIVRVMVTCPEISPHFV